MTLTREQVQALRAKYNIGGTTAAEAPSFADREIAATKTDISEGIRGAGRTIADIPGDTRKVIQESVGTPDSNLEVMGQAAGAIGTGVAKAGGELFTGAAKALLPERAEEVLGGIFTSGAKKVIGGPIGKEIVAKMAELRKSNPRLARNIDAALGIAEGAATLTGVGAAKQKVASSASKAMSALKTTERTIADILPPGGAGGAARAAADAVAETTAKVGEKIAEKAPGLAKRAKGAVELAREAGQKIKTGAKRADEILVQKAEEGAARPTLTAAEQTVKAAAVPDRITTYLKSGNKRTLENAKEMVESAVQREGALAPGKRPLDIAGKSFIDQYKLLDQQRKKVGQEIGQRARELSKTTTVDVSDAIGTLQKHLEDLEVVFEKTEEGLGINLKSSFKSTGFSDKQRALIKDLYEKATEGGDVLTPSQIHAKDRLFATIQREADADQIAKLTFNTAEGETSNLLTEARSVFSEKLDGVDAQIRGLNKEYRPLAQMREQVEKDILGMTDKFSDEAALLDDFAKNAGLALQKTDSNLVSGPRIQRLTKEIDARARALGYDGVSPEEAARFSVELEKLFDIAPGSSFQGRIESAANKVAGGTGVLGKIDKAAGALIDLGAPNAAQQKEALMKLIDELLANAVE